MSGVALKVAIGGFLVWLSAQMGTFAEEILSKVRESVQASELVEIDRYVAYESAFGQDPSKKAHAPKDQAEFERVLREWTTASGNRNVTLDRWEQPYVYYRVPERDPRRIHYTITSKGSDRKIGSADDLVVEREDDHSSINRDPVKIIESAIEQKKALDREVAKKVNDLLPFDELGAKGSGAKAGPRASTAELLDIINKS
jgi:hypothetical protein